MKTPEEIKKGLEAPIRIHYHDDPEPRLTPRVLAELRWLHDDAIALIQQLEAQNSERVRKTEQLQSSMDQVQEALWDNGFGSLEELLQAYSQVQRERDAAVNDLHYLVNHPLSAGPCYACLHENECFPGGACDPAINDHWKWRGISKEGY